jgi:uncharacterized protein
MKKIWFILSIFCFFGISFANTIDPMNLPKFEYFINDYSQVLTQEQTQELNQYAENIESNLGYQVVSVLFPHRQGNELFDIALKAFNENGIGDKQRNDGLLLAIATEEKKIRIMVWYGLEGKIPDLLASQIIEEKIRPEVNQWNIYQGIKNFYEVIDGKQSLPEIRQEEWSDWVYTVIMWIIIFALIVLYVIFDWGLGFWGWSSGGGWWFSGGGWSSGGGWWFSGGGWSSGGGWAGD